MKIVLRSSSLLFSLLGITANAPMSKVQPVLRRGSADGIDIGTSAKQLLEEFGTKLQLDEKTGRLEAFLASPLQRRPDLSFEIKDGVVSAIKVYSRRYKTESGIGVGDALLTLANQHQIHWTDDNIAEVDELKMKFQIQDDRIISILVC